VFYDSDGKYAGMGEAAVYQSNSTDMKGGNRFIAMSPNGKSILSGGDEQFVHVHNITENKKFRSELKHGKSLENNGRPLTKVSSRQESVALQATAGIFAWPVAKQMGKQLIGLVLKPFYPQWFSEENQNLDFVSLLNDPEKVRTQPFHLVRVFEKEPDLNAPELQTIVDVMAQNRFLVVRLQARSMTSQGARDLETELNEMILKRRKKLHLDMKGVNLRVLGAGQPLESFLELLCQSQQRFNIAKQDLIRP